MDAPFQKDFGYLFPFLDKLQAAAAHYPEPARSRLRVLLSEEQGRWAEIQTLLKGQPVPQPTSPTEALVKAEPTHKGPTVGSLRRQP